MLLAERYLQTQLRLETAPKSTTYASSRTFRIIMTHDTYSIRGFISLTTVSAFLVQPEGKELFERQGDTKAPVSLV